MPSREELRLRAASRAFGRAETKRAVARLEEARRFTYETRLLAARRRREAQAQLRDRRELQRPRELQAAARHEPRVPRIFGP